MTRSGLRGQCVLANVKNIGSIEKGVKRPSVSKIPFIYSGNLNEQNDNIITILYVEINILKSCYLYFG